MPTTKKSKKNMYKPSAPPLKDMPNQPYPTSENSYESVDSSSISSEENIPVATSIYDDSSDENSSFSDNIDNPPPVTDTDPRDQYRNVRANINYTSTKIRQFMLLILPRLEEISTKTSDTFRLFQELTYNLGETSKELHEFITDIDINNVDDMVKLFTSLPFIKTIIKNMKTRKVLFDSISKAIYKETGIKIIIDEKI